MVGLRLFPWPSALILNSVILGSALVASYLYSSLWYFIVGFVVTYILNSILRKWQLSKLAKTRTSMVYGEQILETPSEWIQVSTIIIVILAVVLLAPCLILGYEDYNLYLAGLFLVFSVPLMLSAWFPYYHIDGQGIVEHSAVYPMRTISWTRVERVNVRQSWPRALELFGNGRKISIEGTTELDALAQIILDKVPPDRYSESMVILRKMAKKEYTLPNAKQGMLEFVSEAFRHL